MDNSRLSTEISLLDNSDKYIMRSRRKQQLLATLAHSKSQVVFHLTIIRSTRAEITDLEEEEAMQIVRDETITERIEREGIKQVDSREVRQLCTSCQGNEELVTLGEGCSHSTCLECILKMRRGFPISSETNCLACQTNFVIMETSIGRQYQASRLPSVLPLLDIDLKHPTHRRMWKRLEATIDQATRHYRGIR